MHKLGIYFYLYKKTPKGRMYLCFCLKEFSYYYSYDKNDIGIIIYAKLQFITKEQYERTKETGEKHYIDSMAAAMPVLFSERVLGIGAYESRW